MNRIKTPCGCTDRNGHIKHCYYDKRLADLQVAYARQERRKPLKVYCCPCLNGYHLTSID